MGYHIYIYIYINNPPPQKKTLKKKKKNRRPAMERPKSHSSAKAKAGHTSTRGNASFWRFFLGRRFSGQRRLGHTWHKPPQRVLWLHELKCLGMPDQMCFAVGYLFTDPEKPTTKTPQLGLHGFATCAVWRSQRRGGWSLGCVPSTPSRSRAMACGKVWRPSLDFSKKVLRDSLEVSKNPQGKQAEYGI